MYLWPCRCLPVRPEAPSGDLTFVNVPGMVSRLAWAVSVLIVDNTKLLTKSLHVRKVLLREISGRDVPEDFFIFFFSFLMTFI